MNDSSRPDDEIRELLDEAVAHIEPREGLSDIRSRTTVRPMPSRRSWTWGAGAAVLATAATVAAVTALSGGFGTTPSAGPGLAESPSDGHSPALVDSATPQTEQQLSTVPVYYLGQTGKGPRLYREFHHVRADRDLAVEAVDEALRVRSLDPDYTSPWWGTRAEVASVTSSGGVITVDLLPDGDITQPPAGMTGQEASMAVEQLIYTAQAALQVRDPVQFTANGGALPSVFGVPTAEPVVQASTDDTLAQVWIIDPSENSRVNSGFTVNGLANTFEANVRWELKQGDTVVRKSFTTAKECCTMAPFSFTVNAPPGVYTLVVHDVNESHREGFAPWQDTKDITIVR